MALIGNGFSIIPIGRGQFLVQSVPGELNLDHSQVLQQVAGKNQAYISVTVLENELNWTSERARRALDFMVQEGYVWFESQSPVEHLYWFPSLITECMNADKDNS
uniref:Vacuolar-sorting protein SNF8 n=1 Tax=Cacopsylla melanoneura TaxID=428564 RepID=A0A8D8W1J9_9HEMI